MKSNKNFRNSIKIKIIKFFDENPSSIDSARGIAAWIGENIEIVKKCLEELEKEGVLIAHKTNFVTAYSYTIDKKILIKIRGKYLKE